METYLPISYLNDFIFCPYSIYLHQVFDEGEDETFSAQPQQKGETAHKLFDEPKAGAKGERGIYVISHNFTAAPLAFLCLKRQLNFYCCRLQLSGNH